MGLRYRKSINLGGGFRVNLSKSGVGYSWGTKGYRVTKTASGKTRQTVSIPGTGISYVEEHGKAASGKSASSAAAQQVDPLSDYQNIKQVVSADASTLRSAEYDELFKKIKRAKLIVYGLLVVTILAAPIPPLFWVLLLATVVARFLCRASIEYDFDDSEREKWDTFSSAWRAVASSQVLKQITLNAKSKDARVTAGIENAIQAEKMTAGGRLPWYLKTNIKPVVFNFKQCKMAIMPDRLLIFDKKLGALDYGDVHFDLSAVGYLESEKVPSDAEIVQHVWAYANKDGSPDKRYSNNKQYPVMKYAKFVITSGGGLNLQFMCSNEAAADRLNSLINVQ